MWYSKIKDIAAGRNVILDIDFPEMTNKDILPDRSAIMFVIEILVFVVFHKIFSHFGLEQNSWNNVINWCHLGFR